MLRYYQQTLHLDMHAAWNAGHQNVMPVMPTGSGKTVSFTHEMGLVRRSCAIAHRQELVGQMSMALARNNVRHTILADKKLIREVVDQHMQEFKRSYYDVNAPVAAAGVDTLIRMSPHHPVFQQSDLAVVDEGHHCLASNKWGTALSRFTNARGMLPTATPRRTDKKGLGRKSHGLVDVLIRGAEMRELMDAGYLCDYDVYVAADALDTSQLPMGSGGEFREAEAAALHKRPKVVGDIVGEYLLRAPGKLGVTFCFDLEEAARVAEAYNLVGIPAAVIDGTMDAGERAKLMRMFRSRQLLQLVSVDVLGEGVDVPAIEVISFGRATASLITYMQQFGRGLRPLEGKIRLIVIDHVGNFLRHGPPEKWRDWNLDPIDSKRLREENTIVQRTCANPDAGAGVPCARTYERFLPCCPHCGYEPIPLIRSGPAHVDGNMMLVDDAWRARMLGEIERIRQDSGIIARDAISGNIAKQHRLRKTAVDNLAHEIAVWAGGHRDLGRTDAEIYMRFYHTFGIDTLTAQTLSARDAEELTARVVTSYISEGVYDGS